jgi:hypothetical protein
VHTSILILAATLIGSARLAAQSTASLDTADIRRWRDDLATLRTEMPARHANLFHDMSRAQFDSALSSIDARLPQLQRQQVIVELEKLAALVGDGHSNVGPWRDSLIAFHTLPVALYWFSEGIIIRSTDSAHTDLLGARVIEIGGLPIDSAIARVRPLSVATTRWACAPTRPSCCRCRRFSTQSVSPPTSGR